MVFGRKKKKMIDIRKLQEKGRVRSPDFMPRDLDTDSDGFVEVGRTKRVTTVTDDSVSATSDSTYVDVSSTSSSFSTESQGYSKREVDSKLQQLDTIIYKLEQRVELLEKKLGVSGTTSSISSAPSGSLIGW